MNRQHVALLVLHDLSAAFDIFDHNTMLETLHKLGFKAMYLSGLDRIYLGAVSEYLCANANRRGLGP